MCQYSEVNSHKFKIDICNICTEIDIQTESEISITIRYGVQTAV